MENLSIEMLPVINKIVTDAESQLSALAGMPIRLSMSCNAQQILQGNLEGVICELFGITWADMTSRSRKTNLVDARTIYCYYMYSFVPNTTTTWLGEVLHRDHTTIVHLVQRARKLVAVQDDIIMKYISIIDKRIQSPITNRS